MPSAYIDAALRLSSPILMGPPLCDELLALVQHVFSEEEAALVRRLRPFVGRSIEHVARAEGRRADDVAASLVHLADDVGAIIRMGNDAKPKFSLMPLVPGMFEMILVRCPPEKLTPWHQRFAELFEAVYDTGYVMDYAVRGSAPTVRYLPVGGTGDIHPMALPSDKLEVVLDRFDAFAVGPCQCRIATAAVGRGCGKPLDNCLVMGDWARRSVEQGVLRAVPKAEALALKREAESHGMVNWMMNVGETKSQSSCSCCGCCCHAMRVVNEFNAPGMFAPPHFLPALDASKCTYCGKCATDCPMRAIVVDRATQTWQHLPQRCIGCGLCALSCRGRQAIAMQPVPDYKLPYRSWFSLIMHAAPGMLSGMWRTWRSRK